MSATAVPGKVARFSIVGVLGTISYYALLWGMVRLFTIPVMVSTSIAFVVVTVQNYLLHHQWTFDGYARHTSAFPKFVVMNVVGFWINWSIMAAGVHRLHLNYLFVQAVAIIAVVLWNFCLSAFWIFREIGNTAHRPQR